MSNDAWDSYDSTPPAAIDSEPSEDGYYKVSVQYVPRDDKPANALLKLVVLEPAASAGYTIITNLNDPSAYPNSVQLQLSKWKALALSCTNRKAADFAKCKTFADRAAFYNGATAHVFFRPAVLVKNSTYPGVDFITEEKYKASVGNNGKLMRAHVNSAPPAAASRKEEFGDL